MKTQSAKGYSKAFTLTELLVIIGVLTLLSLMIPAATSAAKRKAQRINCVNNLHEITTAFRVWGGDHGDKYPMQMVLTNSETMKLVADGHAYVLWQMMSNVLSTPKVLVCPADTECFPTTNFAAGFSDSNINYFLGLDATENFPNMILNGDDNLAINGVRVKPGILNLPATGSLAWTKARHVGDGNVSMADGSVQQLTTSGLNAAVINATNGTGLTTFRLVIP